MKLVDILARELKIWPEGLECLSQQKGSGYIINGKGFDGRAFDSLQIADETRIAGAIVTRAEWQAAVEALKDEQSAELRPTERSVEWDGVGLPPVGKSVCEYLGARQFDLWTVVDVIAVWGEGNNTTVFVDYGDGWRAEKDPCRFRPVRTQEQIAAEEREKAITDIAVILGKDPERPFIREKAAIIYDAGYRKQVSE